MNEEQQVTPESITEEFPGWQAWQGIDRLWHARIRGATPPVMVHDDDLTGLREEILRAMSRSEERVWQERHPL